MPHCHSNACGQGRKPCPTPQACEIPAPDLGLGQRDPLDEVSTPLTDLLALVACLGMVFLIGFLLGRGL
jgi:hypothetical protein